MAEETGQEIGKEGQHSPLAVKIGVIVTIIASIASLITTGVATLFGAMVADDQLDQSRQVAEEKERAQAGLISYWVDLQHDGRARLHLMNRSPDPISNVHMTFAVPLPAEGNPDLEEVLFALSMPSVPPCSDMTFTTGDMTYTVDEPLVKGKFIPLLQNEKVGKIFPKAWEPLPPIKAFAADFNDRDGVRWRRTRGLLSRDPGDLRAKRGRYVGFVQVVSPQNLPSCGR
ncbi:hypothetical protein [Streptomyces lavendulocolor]|uniref:hypothetical protein n=1 Tax=Streptomyces lavendulocolor TaxID=67316 RepID=UPI003C3025B6